MNNPTPYANVRAVAPTTKQQAQVLYQQLEACFEANSGGGPMPEVLNKLQSLALHLRWTYSPLAEKTGSFVLLAYWRKSSTAPGKAAATREALKPSHIACAAIW